MYAPPLIDGAYSNPPAPTTYSTASALSLPPHRTLSSSASGSLHATSLSASSPSYYAPSLYSFPLSSYLAPTASSSSSSYPGLPSSSPPPGLSLFSSPSSSPHSSQLSGRSTPSSVSNLQAVLDAAELSEQRDNGAINEATAGIARPTKRARRIDVDDGSSKRKRRRNSQRPPSASLAPSSNSLPATPSATLPCPPPVSPVSLAAPVDRQLLLSAFAVPSSVFPSASWHRQWLRERKQLFRSYVGAPITDSDAVLVGLLRRAARVFAALGGGRTANGEKVEQYRVERELLLALFASELPLPLVTSLFDVSSTSVKRLLEQTSSGDELEQYINQAKQQRLAQPSSSSHSSVSAARPRNLICKRTGRPMRDENAFAQSFFQRPQLAHADISTVWQEYVRETTAAAAAVGGGDGAEARKPPLSRAHFFTLAPEERKRKKKGIADCALTSCQQCGTVKRAKEEEKREQQQPQERAQSEKMAIVNVRAGRAADAAHAKRAKLPSHSDDGTRQPQQHVTGRKKAGRPKRTVQKSSLTSEMRALLPTLLAEQQSALSALPAATADEHRVELVTTCS